jgi:hypothetical protein
MENRQSPAATSGPACPCCGKPSTFLPSSAPIYNGRDFGPVYICFGCRAWVGCHRGTTRPLGRLADAELRDAKKRAHAAFDRTWARLLEHRQATDPKYPRRRARANRYKHLASLLGIPASECHIGMFDVATCEHVIDLCERGELDAVTPDP